MTLQLALVIRGDASGAKAALAQTTAETQKLGAAAETAGRKTGAQGTAMRKAAGDAQALATSQRGAALQTGNLFAQFQDIGVMLAAGQSPLQLALQQGTQISQVIGPLGAGGAVKALGTAFLSLLSPINLITIGSIAAGAAMFQWLTGAGTEAKSLEDAVKNLDGIVDSYVANSKRASASTEELAEDFGLAAQEARGLYREMAEADLRAAERTAAGFADVLANQIGMNFPAREIGDQAALGDVLDLSVAWRENRKEINAVIAAMDKLAAADGVEAQLAATVALRDRFKAAAEYSGEISAGEDAILALITEQVVALQRVTSETKTARGEGDGLAVAADAIAKALGLAGSVDLASVFSSASGPAAALLGTVEAMLGQLAAAAGAYVEYGRFGVIPGTDQPRGSFTDGGMDAAARGEALKRPNPFGRIVSGAAGPSRSGNAGGGGGARDEADDVAKLIEKLREEQATLQETDPLQKALLAYRTELAAATGAQRAEIEGLVAANLKAEAATESLGNAAQSAGDALIDALMGGKNAGDQLIDTLIKAGLQAALLGQGPLAGLFGGGGTTVGGVGGLIGGLLGGFMKKADGGIVHGPGTGTSDDIPALLSNGEYVVNARAASRHRALLDAMNNGGLPGFAAGGAVGGGSGRASGGAGGFGGGFGGRMVIELGEGLEGRIVERANNDAVEIVRRGITAYDRILPDRVRDVSRDPRGRR